MSEREIELKAVVDDPERLAARLGAHGAAREFRGRMSDRRYDLPSRALEARDEVLRVVHDRLQLDLALAHGANVAATTARVSEKSANAA